MNVKISKFKANGTVSVPQSKSIIHRELIMAFLATNEVTISNVTFSNDVNATTRALVSMGADIMVSGNNITFKKPNRKKDYALIDCDESGSTLRFLIPIASRLIKHVRFIGKESLFRRPLSIYEDILDKENIKYEKGECFLEIYDSMKPMDFSIRGDVSSQFISGLIMMNAIDLKGSVTVDGPFESKEYVDITIDVLKRFGYIVDDTDNTYSVKKHIENGISAYDSEKDYSQAAFFMCLGALNGNVRIKGMNANSLQGDKKVFDILKSMGANIRFDGSDIVVSESNLLPVDIDLKSMIDSGPILFVLASLIDGDTHITGTRRLRIKESDRIDSMKEELEKCGVNIEVFENDVIIHGKREYKGDYSFDGHNDHRVVMALSIFASMVDGTTTINGIEAIKKSYVSFFDDLKGIGGKIHE